MLLASSLGLAAASPRRHSKRAATIPDDPVLARARERVLGASPLAMFYYTDDALGLASIGAHSDAMTVLAPQCFGLDRAGNLHGQVPAALLEAERRAGLPLMPLVTNSGFDRAAAHALLHNARAEQRAARLLAETAKRDEFVGWQLDFENLAPADKSAYTRFVTRVAAAIHRDHRLLSVAVVVRFSDSYPDRSKQGFYTGEWGAAFDYRGLGRAADLLALMAYDQHTPVTPPGPVAGYDWVKAAIEYAVHRVPASKLLLGVPLYGREWVETANGATAHSLAFKDLNAYLNDPRSEKSWDALFRTTWFKLRDGDTERTAWFDDARSLREKLKLVEIYHLRGYAAWRLGMEDPEFWEPIHEP